MKIYFRCEQDGDYIQADEDGEVEGWSSGGFSLDREQSTELALNTLTGQGFFVSLD